MKLLIDNNCIRCGICIDTCADLFEKDEAQDVIRVKVDEIPDSLKKAAEEAVQACAVGAIRVID
jgi:ferredoxin